MSNHDGSYLINEVLCLFKQYGAFDFLGKEKTLQFLKAVSEIGDSYDCNDGEILEGIGEDLGICYDCWEYGSNFDDGLCEKCRD